MKYALWGILIISILCGCNNPITGAYIPTSGDGQIYYEEKGKGYCPVCGEALNEEAKAYNIDGYAITLDNKCMGLRS